ncbi:unnamed protein product [Nippostrongylus brasiliensis]|uniref:Coronin-like protein cor-1 (inferred by orthology to a C. elegans protein) n=1 Tax=Nippostrongylus brasiliensis TaxID=27835 RepID=A0A158QZT4_NIPBR|nr:unnamed protein product [Nippostrongylus brasiliensis]
MGHEGVKPQRAIFVRDGRVITTGFTKRSERLYALRAPGDCAIRYYEVNQEYPYMHYINTYTTSEPQRAVGFQSKRGGWINTGCQYPMGQLTYSAVNTIIDLFRIYKLTTKGVVDVLQFFVPRKSDLFQHDLYPDTRSTVPALTAEEFMEGKNAAPNMMPVNPAAAQAKPKIQVAKKANILNQLAPTAAESASPRSYSEQPSPQVSAPPSPRPHRTPVVDDDMGIVNLRSRGERDGGGGAQTAGQRRAAAELERIKRDQARTADADDLAPPPARMASSPRMSASSIEGPTNMEELLADLAKMKAVMRQHERRIRILEEEIAEKNMSQAYSF